MSQGIFSTPKNSGTYAPHFRRNTYSASSSCLAFTEKKTALPRQTYSTATAHIKLIHKWGGRRDRPGGGVNTCVWTCRPEKSLLISTEVLIFIFERLSLYALSDWYNILCTVNTQHTPRQDAIITIRLYIGGNDIRIPLCYWDIYIYIYIYIYRVSQEESARLRESVPYVKLYRYNPKHLYPKLNGYGDNGQRKVWSSCGFHVLYLASCA